MEQQQTNLECLRCGNTMELLGEKAFQHASAFDFDGFIVHRCPTCGKVEFFEFIVEDVECVECGATIAAGQQACPACGWTWIESDE